MTAPSHRVCKRSVVLRLARIAQFSQDPTPTRILVTDQYDESALDEAVPSSVKCSLNREVSMKLKVQIAKTELAPVGVHAATVHSVKAKGDNKCVVEFSLVHDGTPYMVSKDYPAKLDRTSPLLRDAETILGVKFADMKASEEFDLETLVTKACQVVVQQKRSNGGRMVAAVDTVLASPSPTQKLV